MKIRTQLFAGIVIFTIILAVVSALVITTNQEVERLIAQENTANAIALEVGELGYLSNDYILYREPLQAQRWDAKFSSISDSIENLSLDTPEQRAIASSLKTNLQNTRSVFDDIFASPVQPGGTDTGFIQLSWSRMAVQNQGMIFDAGRLAHLIQLQIDDLRQTRTLLIFALMGSFVAFLLTSYFLFYRRMMDSINDLQNGAKIIGSGNLGYTLPERADDEISDLSRSFNRMTSDLRGVIATRTDLEREVAARIRAEEDLRVKNEDLNALNEELTAAQEEMRQNLDELVRSESALQKISQERQIALDAAKLGWWHYDPMTRISRFDERYRQIFGVAGEEMPNDEILASRIHPEDLPGLWARVEAALDPKDPKPYAAQYRINLPGGMTRWIEAHGTVTFEESQEPRRAKSFVGTVEDVTERKVAEERLQRQQAEIQTLLENTPAGLVLFEGTPPYKVIAHNHYYQELFAEPFHSKGMVGLNIYQYAPAAEAEGVVAVFDEVVRTGQPKTFLDFPYRSSPPGQSWFNWHLAPVILGGQVAALVSMSLDVTDRHRAEEALRESEERLQMALKTSRAGTWDWDIVKGTIIWSPQLFVLFGLDPESDRASFDTWDHILHPEDLKAAGERIEVALRDHTTLRSEYRIILPGGKIRWIYSLGEGMYGEQGQPVRMTGLCMDITEHKQAVEALRASEEKFSIIFHATTIAKSLASTDGRLNDVNEAWLQLTGFTRKEEVLGKTSNELGLIQDIETRQRLIEEFQREGSVHNAELAMVARDGTRRELLVDMQAVEIGGQSFILSTNLDITERKRAEQELLRKNEKLGEINEELSSTQEELQHNYDELTKVEHALRETSQYLENLIGFANAPIIVWDPQFRITRFNHAFERLTGRLAVDVVGKTLEILFPGDTREESMHRIIQTAAGERWEAVEIPILRVDGGTSTVLWNSATLYKEDGKTILSTIAQGQDITGRKIAEENNLRAREEWERTFNTVPDLIAILDADYRILRVNLPMAHRLGRTPEECVGLVCHEAVHGTSVPPEFCPHTSTCRDGKQHIVEVHEPALGGHFIVSTTPLYSMEGHLIGSVHVAHDITERTRIEDELRKTVHELKRSNQDLEQFAYVASHDLQEPLRNVTLFSQLFLRKYGDTISGEGKEYLDFVIEGSTRMSTLIHDLLDFSRITTRGEAFVPVDMNNAVEDACTNLQALIQESGSSVTYDHLPVVNADPVQIRQVLQNLIDNAVKYRSAEPPRVHIAAEQQDGEWIFSVKDNGIGIAPEYHEKIFQLFKRLHTRQKYSGTGIGLSLVKKIIERHGGRIWVDSAEGRGATFFFTLKA